MKKRVVAILTVILVLFTSILTSVSANAFADIKESDWFYNDVKYVRDNKLMSGTSDSEFSPTGVTTRGMIVTVLWRLEGEPKEIGKAFEDVKEGTYYYDAVAWASNNEIVSGYSDTVFGPNDTATREQLATIIYRFASYKKCDISKEAELDKFVDKNQISEYALKSIKWANANGLITGTSEETISPKNDVQRSQLAAILKRFCVNIIDENKDQDKTDTEAKEEGKKPTGGILGGGNTSDKDTDEDNNSSSGTTEKPSETASVNISVDAVNAKPGEEVEVAVKIENNPGILGMTLVVSYDDTMCSLISSENGDAVAGILSLSYSNEFASGMKFLWDGEKISEDSVKDGSVLLLTFKVNDEAEEGVCDITVEAKSIVDNDLNKIKPIIKNGEISVLNN